MAACLCLSVLGAAKVGSDLESSGLYPLSWVIPGGSADAQCRGSDVLQHSLRLLLVTEHDISLTAPTGC